MLPSAHLSPQPKRHLDRFGHSCTAHDSVSMGMPGIFFPLKVGGISTPSSTWFFECAQPTTQTASQSVQRFLHSSRQTVPILYSGRPFPQKLCLPIGDLDPHLIHGFLGPPESPPPPPPQTFYGPFSRTTRVSRCQKRTSGLYGARED